MSVRSQNLNKMRYYVLTVSVLRMNMSNYRCKYQCEIWGSHSYNSEVCCFLGYATMQFNAFWVVILCNQVGKCCYCAGKCYLHLKG